MQEKETDITRQEAKLQRGLRKQEKLILAKREEMVTLENQKISRTRMLNDIKKDRNYLSKKLRDRQEALDKIARLIREQQEKPKSRTPVMSQVKTDFHKLKGKLGWPVKGRITGHYGWHQDAGLKTKVLNPGVDITGTSGAEAKAPCAGRVAVVTWQRGMGNLILINHGNEYITVYGHLDMVLVEPGQDINQGTVIGHIGDSESIYGPSLHFEVWKGKKHLNPKLWLLK